MPSEKPLTETKYDIRSFGYNDIEKVALPQEEDVAFVEEQGADIVWIWAFLGFETFVVMLLLLLSGMWWLMFPAGVVMALSMALISSFRLQTRMDQEGVHFRMKPLHRKERTIRWEEMDMIHVRKYNAITEYGGYGMRGMGKNRAYNAGGNMGIQIKMKDGRKILLGTRMAEAAKDYLGRRPLMV